MSSAATIDFRRLFNVVRLRLSPFVHSNVLTARAPLLLQLTRLRLTIGSLLPLRQLAPKISRRRARRPLVRLLTWRGEAGALVLEAAPREEQQRHRASGRAAGDSANRQALVATVATIAVAVVVIPAAFAWFAAAAKVAVRRHRWKRW